MYSSIASVLLTCLLDVSEMVASVVHEAEPMQPEVVVRQYDPERDRLAVEDMERCCEVGSSADGKMALFTDLLGDPFSRVRHCPCSFMLVAEVVVRGGGPGRIVGVVRGCVKDVTGGGKLARCSKSGAVDVAGVVPVYTKLAYLLGLRVSPTHRRMGIALKLAMTMEAWFRANGAEYSYMATETDNKPSLNLFTRKLGYHKFRTPAILVQPVFAHRARVPAGAAVRRFSPDDAEPIYRRYLAAVEFFPRDIGAVLRNKLTLATFLAVPASDPVYGAGIAHFPGTDRFLADPPSSWAVVSVWSCKDVFRLEVRGASRARRWAAAATRAADRALPWLRLPSVPDVFRPFGAVFMYGLGGSGPGVGELVGALCAAAHNVGREEGCRVVAAEVAAGEPLRAAIPHWRRLSCSADMWCMKRLADGYSEGAVGDWTKAPPGLSIFVDPRVL